MKLLACTGISETPDQGPTLSDIDLKKTLLQHLDSLQWSGLGDLSSQGGLKFELDNLKPVATSATSTTSSKTAAAAEPSAAKTSKAKPSPSKTKPSITETESESPSASPQPVSSQPTLLAEGSYGQPIADTQQRSDALNVLAEEVSGCVKCPELCRNRTNTVFGVGPADAKIVFLGEGPGANEDQQGEPFVGAAGQLLDKILCASQFSREQVSMVNVVKCRTPANRNPADSEIQNCWNYLERQLEIIQPTHIACLGSVAAKSLLNTKLPLGKMRKKWHQYRDSKVIVTYHPAYLLRTPSAKKHVWEDMKLLMADFGVEL